MKSVMRSYCGGCYDNRPFEKQRASHVLHLLLSIVTAGFWLPLWFLCGLSAALQPYRCRTCAKSRWFQSSRREMEDAEIDALTDNLSSASRRYEESRKP